MTYTIGNTYQSFKNTWLNSKLESSSHYKIVKMFNVRLINKYLKTFLTRQDESIRPRRWQTSPKSIYPSESEPLAVRWCKCQRVSGHLYQVAWVELPTCPPLRRRPGLPCRQRWRSRKGGCEEIRCFFGNRTHPGPGMTKSSHHSGMKF